MIIYEPRMHGAVSVAVPCRHVARSWRRQFGDCPGEASVLGQATRRDRLGLRGLAETGPQSGRLLQGRLCSALEDFRPVRADPRGTRRPASLNAGAVGCDRIYGVPYGDTGLTV